ncbi:BQ2448_3174 [Microbotryum intermedium]|uniref:BQ2448_3174 protein n=1 Tax=Microbotryum intermedium TaxID=269621 RepID=A0A238FKJ9_9BASI|nr:BQ2448_3174 [Microbotryum intermedium]
MSPSTNAGSSGSRNTGSGLHARTGSIKRTPSDLSRDLASVDLPPPSAITAAESYSKDLQRRNTVEKELDELDLDEPEGQCMRASFVSEARQGGNGIARSQRLPLWKESGDACPTLCGRPNIHDECSRSTCRPRTHRSDSEHTKLPSEKAAEEGARERS